MAGKEDAEDGKKNGDEGEGVRKGGEEKSGSNIRHRHEIHIFEGVMKGWSVNMD